MHYGNSKCSSACTRASGPLVLLNIFVRPPPCYIIFMYKIKVTNQIYIHKKDISDGAV